jgi:Tol biopolymer transport system component
MRISKLFCVLFLGLFLLAVLAGDALAQKGKPQPPPPPPPTPGNPAFAYVVAGQNQYNLMVMNADGSNQRAVVSQKFTGNTNPDWSPDGKQLVFSMEKRDRSISYYTVKVDGSALTPLWNSSYIYRPAWSPVPLGDGQYKIAFGSRLMPDGTVATNSDLLLRNVNGTGLATNLTNTPDIDEGDVDWSPTAERLVVSTYDGVLSDLVIYRVDCDIEEICWAVREGSVYNVPRSPLVGRSGYGFDWAKTADKLVVSANTALDGSQDLWIIDLANPSQPLQLTNTPGVNEYNPTWSPDDSLIAFMSNPRGGSLTLQVMNSDGTNRKTVPLPAGIASAWGVTWRRNP